MVRTSAGAGGSNQGRTSSRLVRFAIVLIVLAALAGSAAAVAINPIALYIDGRTRSGALTLYNDGALPEEIQIDFAFGYPRSDSTGRVGVALSDTAPTGEPSAAAWLTAFPRRLVLQPGQRQAVRLLVEPPPGTPDGEYWARVLVKSRGGQPPIEQQNEAGVRVQVDLETIVAVPLSYRQGQVRTGVAVQQAVAALRGDSVAATIDLERTGNAAYLGLMRAELLDGRGRVVAAQEEYVGVYRELRRMLHLAVPEAAADGPLRVRFRLEARRDDLPPGGPLPADDVAHTVDVTRP